MKVNFPSENKTPLINQILQFQLILELSQLQELLSAYSDFLLFFAEYSFLFETSPTETSLSQSTYTPSDTSFSSQDPARDGGNWWNYCNSNPVKYVDLMGLCGTDYNTVGEWFNGVGECFKAYFNLDFGNDWANATVYNFENGNYATGIVDYLNGVAETAIDLGICYLGAVYLGAAITGISTTVTSSSILEGYVCAEIQLDSNLRIVNNSFNNISGSINNNLNSVKKLFTKHVNSKGNLGTEYARVDNISNIEKYGQNLGKDGQLFLTYAETINNLDFTTKSGLQNAEQILGLPNGQLSNSNINVITTVNTSRLNVRLPTSGNEFFIPGGITSGGAHEIVVNPMNIFTDPSVISIQFIQQME